MESDYAAMETPTKRIPEIRVQMDRLGDNIERLHVHVKSLHERLHDFLNEVSEPEDKRAPSLAPSTAFGQRLTGYVDDVVRIADSLAAIANRLEV